MSDIISALHDDAEEYQALLWRYGIEPRGSSTPGLGYLDYDHLTELRSSRRQEVDK